MYDQNYLKVINEAEEEEAIEKYEKKHLKIVRGKVKSKLEYVLTNYNPFIGMLPGRTQERLKVIFRELNPIVASRASAIFWGLGASLIGVYLDGFDIGFSVGERENINSVNVFKPIYFSLLGGGFSRQTTGLTSVYLILESINRLIYMDTDKKPIGNFVLELANYFRNRLAFNKGYKLEAEKEINLLKERNNTIEDLLG